MTFAGLMLTGCKDFDCCMPTVIKVDPTAVMLELSVNGNTEVVDVTSDLAWKVVDKPDWITVTDDNGSAGTVSVTITGDINDTGEERTDVVVFMAANGDRAKLTVTQTAEVLLAPVISNLTIMNALLTSEGVYVQYDLDEDATVYTLILLATDPLPTKADVISSVWNVALTAGNGKTSGFGSLTPDTEYKLYMVAENAGGISAVVSVTFTTLIAPPVISFSITAPTLTGTTIEKRAFADVQADLYGVIYAQGIMAPSASDIKAHSDANVIAWRSTTGLPGGSVWDPIYIGLNPVTAYTLYMVAENAGGFSSVISLDFTTTAASDDAGIRYVGAQSVTLGAEAGTIASPITASVTVSNGFAYIGTGQVSPAIGATATIYTESTFTTAGNVSLTVGVPTHVYIKVIAEDGATTLYYDITVTRSA